MADEAKTKAEKLAAAKKRVEQLKKAKAKKSTSTTKAEDTPDPEVKEGGTDDQSHAQDTSVIDQPEQSTPQEDSELQLNTEASTIEQNASRDRAPSLSIQSKLRSESFKQGGPLSPSADGDSAPDIYRKQVARIEELEKDNKRLLKEASEGEKRWKKAEEELEDLRDAESSRPTSKAGQADDASEEVGKLQAEIAALQRQNDQLQAQTSRTARHGSTPSISTLGTNELTAQLASKSSTIESMELEISNLKAQLARTAKGSSAEQEQVTALEEKLSRTQKSLDTSQQELNDLKKNLERTTEKAVKEGSERVSAETKLATLTRESAEAKEQTQELLKKVETLEKKITTLTTLLKEHDTRAQALRKEREQLESDAAELRARFGSLENENLRMKEAHERTRNRDAVGVDDGGVEELENEEKARLEARIQELEAETTDLRRGIWKDKRDMIEGNDLASPDSKFQDIDLGGTPVHRRSTTQTKGFGDYFASTVSAFIPQVQGPDAEDGLLDDDEFDFDEEAFAKARAEENQRRIERVKEIKRGLNKWKGWKLDIVETRRNGGEGYGVIFEV